MSKAKSPSPSGKYCFYWRACAVTLLLTLIHLGPQQLFTAAAQEQQVYEINTVLMETTFRIEGKDKDGNTRTGTVFIVGKPESGDSSKFRHVLVTAAHVLDDIADTYAVLHLRKQTGVNEWERFIFALKIRTEDKILWVKHPDADVAAMYFELPEAIIPRQLGIQLLADDTDLQEFDIHPGDNLNCLGFPWGLESGKKEGFPVLRSGRIASYPLLPTRQRKTFMFDFEIFGGNSGGPVYFADTNRIYNQKSHLGRTVQLVVGLVSQEISVFQKPERIDDKPKLLHPLKMAEVVHASLIKDTIALLK